MTTATQANVAKLYIATFGRAPDGPGLNYWVNQSGLSLEQIAKSFFDQPETQAKFGTSDNASFVAAIYQNVLGRAGEAGGVAYWISQLESGALTRDNIILAVLGGAQGSDATLLENRTESGLTFALIGTGSPDAFAVINETTAAAESVVAVKEWIMGKTPAETPPSQYKVLDDNRTDYNLTGSAKDDVFVVEAFKTANIKGGEGSDTLDFQDFTPGVNVNLSTGLGPNGSAGTAMKLEWIENVRGTSGNDTLIGNSDANILVAGGGVDFVDGGVGNDRMLFRTVEDVKASTINGGQNEDTLEITNQTAINVDATTFSKVSDTEILQVGYSDEGEASAATITVTGGTPLNVFKEIRGTTSYDKKGNATDDVIQSALNLDVSGVKLTSIEELRMTATESATAGDITIGKDTLTSVKKVTGFTDGTTDLVLKASAGDTFDLTQPTFTNIDRVAQLQSGVPLADVATTLIVNQSLINSLAASDKNDGFGAPITALVDNAPSAGFTASTLKASGIGLDLSALVDGDTNFKVIQFGTAKEVTVGNINDANALTVNDLTALRTITGSDNDSDLLRIKPTTDNKLADFNQDLTFLASGVRTGISITKVERLDFEEISTVALMNANLTNVKQISGDDDNKLVDGTVIVNDAADANDNGTVIDTTYEKAVGGLDLKGKTLQNIAGFGNNVNTDAKTNTIGNVTVDSGTVWDSNFKSLDTDSSQIITAATGGSYDLSTIMTANADLVTIDATAKVTFDDPTKAGQLVDRFIGANASDIVKGAQASMSYRLGGQDDQFIGTNAASEVVLGEGGNDTIALGDNNDVTTPIVGSTNLILSVMSGSNATEYKYFDSATAAVEPAPGLAAYELDISAITDFDGKGAYADGGADDDVITSGAGNDVLIGGTGNDSIMGGAGNDIALGGTGDDILSGGKGNDFLAGGTGNDLIEGNAGEDFLFGGKGQDVLRGGELNPTTGAVDHGTRDHFIFDAGDSGSTASTVDIIKDFLTLSEATKTGATTTAADADMLYLNWFATDAATGLKVGSTDYTLANFVGNAADATGVAAAPTADGVAYSTFFMDLGSSFGIGSATTLEAAANTALDKVTELQLAGQLAAGKWTSAGAQFEYGGKEYVVVDAFVTLGDAAAFTVAQAQAANNYSAINDLIVEVSDSAVNWSLSASDIAVTRWDATVL